MPRALWNTPQWLKSSLGSEQDAGLNGQTGNLTCFLSETEAVRPASASPYSSSSQCKEPLKPALCWGSGPSPSQRLPQSSSPLHCQCCPLDWIVPITIQTYLIISHLINKQNKTETLSSPSITHQALPHFADPLRIIVSTLCLPSSCPFPPRHNPIWFPFPSLCCHCCYQDLQQSPC